ncbi:MAG: sulfatase [Planctomycetales bacterium]|nr:sulfatase [Planctomycetales bacterium]
MIRLLTLTVFVVSSLCFTAAGLANDEQRPRPNILFIYLDDFGWKDTGFMGSDFFETPNLDRLASQGMVFTDAYSCAANCAPARACLLSGQYTPRHKIFNVGTGPRGKAKFRRLKHVPGVSVLDTNIKTWAQSAQQAGYTTASVGKWHLSNDPRPYGFDVNVGGTHSGSPPRGYYPPHNVPGLHDAPEDEYLTDRLSNEAINFIESNAKKPWLLYLTHFAVHTPLNAKRELVEKYAAKEKGKLHNHVAMATMIQAVDDGVGDIIATIERLSLADNTIVIFYSDNGGYGGATDMAPLRGYKGTYYEGGIRVPFFVKWPGAVTEGTTSAEPITGVDLFPTLCEMMSTPLPEGQICDGRSLVPILCGDVKSFDRAIYWHFPAYLQAGGNWKSEARDPLFRTRPCSIIREGDWKLHHYYEDDGVELYNLRTDIGETTNLAVIEPEKTNGLLTKLRAWRVATKAAEPTELNPKFDAVAEEQARRGLTKD